MYEDDASTDYWIKKQNLYTTDYEALQTKEITGSIVNAAESPLKVVSPCPRI